MGMNEPILITGCARSGTSMVAGIINICGAWGGKMSGPTKYNKRGMFENGEIRNEMVKPFLLHEMKCDPMGQHPLPDIDRVRAYAFADGIADIWRRRVMDILFKHGYDGKCTWFYKGAKMCLMWPLWHMSFPLAKWVIVRRVDEDIVYSCMHTSFMRAFKEEAGWQQWVDVHKTRFEEMKSAGLDVLEIWPQQIVNAEFDEARSVIDALGLEWKDEKIIDFVTPALWSSGAISKITEARDGIQSA